VLLVQLSLSFGKSYLDIVELIRLNCVSAEPIIEEVFGPANGVTLIECPVVRSEFESRLVIHFLRYTLTSLYFFYFFFRYKGNPQHPYRTHSALKIRCIPTLIRFVNKKPRERLEEGQIEKTLLQELLDM